MEHSVVTQIHELHFKLSLIANSHSCWVCHAVGSPNRTDHHSLPVGSWDGMDQEEMLVPRLHKPGFPSSEINSHWKHGFCRIGCLSVGRAYLFDFGFQLIFAVDR